MHALPWTWSRQNKWKKVSFQCDWPEAYLHTSLGNIPTETFAERGTFKWAEIWFEMVSASDVSHGPAVSLGLLTLSRWPPHKKQGLIKNLAAKVYLKRKSLFSFNLKYLFFMFQAFKQCWVTHDALQSEMWWFNRGCSEIKNAGKKFRSCNSVTDFSRNQTCFYCCFWLNSQHLFCTSLQAFPVWMIKYSSTETPEFRL